MGLNNLTCLMILAISLYCCPVVAEKRALLIGIADYRDPDSVSSNGDLLGPINDVDEMQKVLQLRWGFRDIRTLINQQATYQGIKSALQQLVNDSQPDDHIYFFYSGHGTSSENNNAPVPYGSGAQLAYDFPFNGTREQQKAKLIIGQRDLQPVFKAIEARGATVFAAIDSCYSGQAVRSFNTELLQSKPLLSRHVKIAADDTMSADLYENNRLPIPPYPYKQVFFISAASDKQEASDINASLDNSPATRSGKSHGAFSDALLRALWGDLPETSRQNQYVNNVQIYQAVKNYMLEKFIQTPTMLPDIEEDNQYEPIAYQAVFGQVAQSADTTKSIPPNLRVQIKKIPTAMQQRLSSIQSLTMTEKNPEYVITKQGHHYLFGFSTGQLITKNVNPDVIITRINREIWFKQLLDKAHANVTFSLDFRLKKDYYGNILMQNDIVEFRLRSDHSGHMVLLDLMPDGTIVPLYPTNPNELKPIPATSISAIPADNMSKIRVLPPYGSDFLMAFYFEKNHPFIKALSQQKQLKPNSQIVRQLFQALDKDNQFGFTHLTLRTVEKL